MSGEKALAFAERLQNLDHKAHEFYLPYVKGWAELQFRLGKVDQDTVENARCFIFDQFTNDYIDFRSEAWEETWSYGGHEWHPVEVLQIPVDFFDNPDKYLKEVEEFERLREKTQKEDDRKSAELRVLRLQEALEAARTDLNAKS